MNDFLKERLNLEFYRKNVRQELIKLNLITQNQKFSWDDDNPYHGWVSCYEVNFNFYNDGEIFTISGKNYKSQTKDRCFNVLTKLNIDLTKIEINNKISEKDYFEVKEDIYKLKKFFDSTFSNINYILVNRNLKLSRHLINMEKNFNAAIIDFQKIIDETTFDPIPIDYEEIYHNYRWFDKTFKSLFNELEVLLESTKNRNSIAI